ncbi:MAG: helix-turn-helix domain-containing protein [Limisphaerales bacterium]
MESDRSFGQHLAIKEVAIAPGDEWAPRAPGWMFVHIASGVGYWMQPGKNIELAAGSTLMFSHTVQGAIRASQLGRTALHSFQVEPERLAGVVTLGEKEFLQRAADRDGLSFRYLPPTDPVSEKFAEICRRGNASSLRMRLQLLELFIRAFDTALGRQETEPLAEMDAKARLELFLKQMTASAMLDLSLSELVKEIRCTPRHLSRIFLETVGMSFREKQAEVRLARARELLETTNSKIYEVAMESGYQSLSLFNFMFRKRFGATPAKWRKQLNSRKPARPVTQGTRPRRNAVEEIPCL